MSDPTLPDRLRSVFSIIELDFKEPFTERGPPEPLEDVFTECLYQLEQEEKPKWIMWGDDLTDPDRICIMIGRKLPSSHRGTTAHAAMSELKAKGLPLSLKPLLPFLITEPSIRHFYSPDRNRPLVCDIRSWQERHCDIFVVDNPPKDSLQQLMVPEMMTLRYESSWLLPTVLRGQSRPWGDVKLVVVGVDECETLIPDAEQDTHVNSFVFIVYWTHPDAMARFKDPDRESIRKYGWKVANDWWRTEVEERFARLEGAGATVKRGTFKLWSFEAGGPLIWADAESLVTASRAGSLRRKPIGKGLVGCRGCFTM